MSSTSARAPAQFSRFLSSPLGAPLLGVELCADLYARNGFRLLGLPASVDHQTLLREAGRLRTMLQLSPKAIDRFCIQIGYDEHCLLDDVARCVGRLQDPRSRLVSEIFWPHAANGLFDKIKSSRHLASSEVLAALNHPAENKSSPEMMLLRHGAAVAYHNLAITTEFSGTDADGREHWTNAFACWRDTLASDAFWKYLRKRTQQFDDPRIKPEDVETIRARLPKLVLEINATFAWHAWERGEKEVCHRHLILLAQSGFPEDAMQSVLLAVLQKIAMRELAPVLQRATDFLADKSRKMKRDQFLQTWWPILNDALAIPSALQSTLDLDANLLGYLEFDSLCERVLDAANTQMDYNTDDSQKSLLATTIMSKRMLYLPLSSTTRRRIESSIENDTKLIYGDFAPEAGFDPTLCFFSDDEEADPEASILLPVYKITSRTVKVDYSARSAGISVSYNHRRLLVPRSAHARTRHEGPVVAVKAVGFALLFGVPLFILQATQVLPAVMSPVDWGVVGIIVGVIVALLTTKKPVGPDGRPIERKPVRSLTTQSEFPLYVAAKAKGFKDGKEPDATEMQMTFDEQQQARRQLGIY